MLKTTAHMAAFSAFFLLAAAPALAQERGQVRIQGTGIPEDTTPEFFDQGILLDYREEMRKLVQSISVYARQQRPNFLIISQNGLDLLAKRDISDEEKSSPARTYMQSIDGIIHDGVLFGEMEFGKPPSDTVTKEILGLIELADSHGLKVMISDYAAEPGAIGNLYDRYGERGYIPFISSTLEMNVLPAVPSRPYNENANSVVSIKDVRNYLYLSDSSSFGRQDEFALKVHDTNYDLVAVDVFHRRLPLTRQAVETLKYKKIGAKRLVFALVDIGSAASYRYYWQPRWREGSPLWISAPFIGDPDRYHVQYWSPEWKEIISGDPQSYIYGAIDQGYDGVILKGLDEYRYFEGGGEGQEEP